YDSSDTPKGVYYINNKARNINLVGADYVSFVEYWMAFIGGSYGIHDASWRSSFGGSIYKGNGSHGCVNTPYEAVKKIYNNVSVGTPVVIHG
ncbi:MAG: L,D-transpeptidase, partial [Ruminococcus sp.]|nr:L,D-transpeptidase [Ruminococcus sp.]